MQTDIQYNMVWLYELVLHWICTCLISNLLVQTGTVSKYAAAGMASSSFQICVVYSLGTRRGRHSSRANYGAMPPNQGAEGYSAEWRALKVGEWARYGEG